MSGKRKKTSTDLALAVEDQGYLRKAAEAIAIKPRAGKLTLLTRKISNILLAEAQEQGISQSTYRIPLSQLCGAAGYDSHNTEIVKEQLRKMVATTVEWQIGAKGHRRWGVTNLLNAEIVENGQRCDIEWDYPVKLKEKLLMPDVYVRLALEMQNSFRSTSAFALYEICARYADSPGQLTMRMPWTEWRPTLTGVPDAEDEDNRAYAEYKYFKRRVLKPAVAEVNALAPNFKVEMMEHKNGRAVQDLQFRVLPKAQKSLDLNAPNLLDMSLLTRMEALGLSASQAERIYSDTDEGRIRAALDYTEKRMKSGAAIENPAGYFRNSLAKGYGGPTKTEAKQLKAAERPEAMPVKTGGPAKLAEQLMDAWRSEQRSTALAAFEGRLPAEQAFELQAFEESGRMPNSLAKVWRDQGVASKMCQAVFVDWLLRDQETPDTMALLQFGMDNGLIPTM